MGSINWLKETTQSYRRGFIEGQAGTRNAYLLEITAENIEEYNRGFEDGMNYEKQFTTPNPEAASE